jgi:CDP-diacylglycerol--glycerol-3-phosphate 3-phosphatidyltransferase
MLDTGLRNRIGVIFRAGAVLFERLGFSPLAVTCLALGVGLAAGLVYLCGFRLPAVLLLWLSGWLDAVDGELARRTKKVSRLGAFLDVWFDRVVECFILLTLGIRYPESGFALLCAALSIILSFSAFLLTGNLVQNRSEKSFFYQSGLMERSEGFIIFSFMWLFPEHLDPLSFLCAALILFTAFQRVILTVLTLRREQ